MAVQQGQIDVANRSLSPTDIEDLSKDPKVKVVKGPGGEERFIAFNFKIQPYGESQPDADATRPRPCARPSPTSSTAKSSPPRSTRHLHPDVLLHPGRPGRSR